MGTIFAMMTLCRITPTKYKIEGFYGDYSAYIYIDYDTKLI